MKIRQRVDSVVRIIEYLQVVESKVKNFQTAVDLRIAVIFTADYSIRVFEPF